MNSMLMPPIAIALPTAVTHYLSQLNRSTTLTLGETLTVFVFITTLVVWLSRKLQKIEDDIEALKKELSSRPCAKEDRDCSIK